MLVDLVLPRQAAHFALESVLEGSRAEASDLLGAKWVLAEAGEASAVHSSLEEDGSDLDGIVRERP